MTRRIEQMVYQLTHSGQQEVFPVVEADGKVVGLVTAATMHLAMGELNDAAWALAADLMQPLVSVSPDDDLRTASELLLTHGLRNLPVISSDGRLLGMLDQSDIAGVYVKAAARAEVDAQSLRS